MEYRGISFSASLALIEGCLAHEAGCRLSSRDVNAYVGFFIDRPSKPAVPSSFGQEYATLGIQVRGVRGGADLRASLQEAEGVKREGLR